MQLSFFGSEAKKIFLISRAALLFYAVDYNALKGYSTIFKKIAADSEFRLRSFKIIILSTIVLSIFKIHQNGKSTAEAKTRKDKAKTKGVLRIFRNRSFSSIIE